MAHFAKLGTGDVVLTVEVVSNDVATTEEAGVQFLQTLYNNRDVWKQTSYNTYGGEHRLGGTPFRKNYATIGGKYDSSRDAFIEPKPHDSWILNETTCLWEAPIEQPTLTEQQIEDGAIYNWNETTQQWDLDD
jgi:hypothetical protein|tara:strand:- start:8 stop:406 length:399 start_codon:yes stop_codon:yes gene_type:complete